MNDRWIAYHKSIFAEKERIRKLRQQQEEEYWQRLEKEVQEHSERVRAEHEQEPQE